MNRLTACQQFMTRILKSFFAALGISPKTLSVKFYEKPHDKDYLYARYGSQHVSEFTNSLNSISNVNATFGCTGEVNLVVAYNTVTGKLSVTPFIYEELKLDVEIVDFRCSLEINEGSMNVYVITLKIIHIDGDISFSVCRVTVGFHTRKPYFANYSLFEVSNHSLERTKKLVELRALYFQYVLEGRLRRELETWNNKSPIRNHLTLSEARSRQENFSSVCYDNCSLPEGLFGSYKVDGRDYTDIDLAADNESIKSTKDLFVSFKTLMEIVSDQERAVLGLKKINVDNIDFNKADHPLFKRVAGFNSVRATVDLGMNLGSTKVKQEVTEYRRFTYLIQTKDNKYKLFVKTQKKLFGVDSDWIEASPENSFILDVEAITDHLGRHTIVLTPDLFKGRNITFQILEGDDPRLKKEIVISRNRLVWNKYSNVRFFFQIGYDGCGLFNNTLGFGYYSANGYETSSKCFKALTDWLEFFKESPSQKKINELFYIKDGIAGRIQDHYSKLPYYFNRYKEWLAEGVERFPLQEPFQASSGKFVCQSTGKSRLKLPNLLPGVKNIYVKDNDIYFTVEEGKSENTRYIPGGEHARFYLRPETEFKISSGSFTIRKVTDSRRMAHEHASGNTFCYGNYLQDFHDIEREVREDGSKVWKLINMFVTYLSFFGATEAYGKYGLQAYKRLD